MLVETYDESGYGVLVYGYGSGTQLTTVYLGVSMTPLTTGFIMYDNISGAEYAVMNDVDIQVGGHLINAEARVNARTVCAMIE